MLVGAEAKTVSTCVPLKGSYFASWLAYILLKAGATRFWSVSTCKGSSPSSISGKRPGV